MGRRPPWLRFRGKPKDAATVGLRHGFRSGLESANAAHLKANGQRVAFEQVKIKYLVPQSVHTYTPDFELENGVIVETKGRFLPIDRAKHLFIKLCHPSIDIRFVFQNPNARIAPKSNTTYAMWADTHGFKWAKKVIPVEWMKEPKRDGTVIGPRTIKVPQAAQDYIADSPRQSHRARAS